MPGIEIRTDRLLLRQFRDPDRDRLAAMNADPRVMEFFPRMMTREESDGMFDRLAAHFNERGFGIWAVEVPGIVDCAGFVGLLTPKFTTHFMPCVELAWRLAADYWGHGYATEGARAAVRFGFDTVGLQELVALTVPSNVRSRRVMEKIGMTYDPADDFDHPNVPDGHPLKRHVLYRIKRGTAVPGAPAR